MTLGVGGVTYAQDLPPDAPAPTDLGFLPVPLGEVQGRTGQAPLTPDYLPGGAEGFEFTGAYVDEAKKITSLRYASGPREMIITMRPSPVEAGNPWSDPFDRTGETVTPETVTLDAGPFAASRPRWWPAPRRCRRSGRPTVRPRSRWPATSRPRISRRWRPPSADGRSEGHDLEPYAHRVRPTLTVSLPSFGEWADGDWSRLVDLAREADAAGVDRVVVPDHVAIGPGAADYPWGRFPRPLEAPWLEPLTVLTAVATATTRVRLSTGILVAPLRPAVLLAKTVATLDALSGGRVDLGVGTGWLRDEFDAAGIDFARRGKLLTDGMAACRALWEGPHASIDRPTVAFDDLTCSPLPVQERLPVLFSGTLHARNVDRIVELGDGSTPIMGASLDDVAGGVARLRAALEGAGRNPARSWSGCRSRWSGRPTGRSTWRPPWPRCPTCWRRGPPRSAPTSAGPAPTSTDTAAGFARLVEVFARHTR